MAYEVKFAGINLSDYCTVLNVERSVLPPRENFSKSIPTMNGSFYTGYHYGEREITLEVYIKAKTNQEYMNKVRQLADALHTEAPSELIISDEPDRYYYAVLDGDTVLDKTVFSGTVQLKFICHDPIAYSNTEEVFEPDSKNVVTIVNNGTTDTHMEVAVKFQNPACFFQATNKDGSSVLIGKPKNLTKKTAKVNTTAVKDYCETLDDFTSLPQALLDNDRIANGNFGVGLNGKGIVCTNFGSSEDEKWTGTAFKRSCGRNMEQFEVAIDFIFSSKGPNYKATSTPDTSSSTGKNYGNYQVTAKSGLIIRESNSEKSKKLATMKKGTVIKVIDVSGSWMKHKTKVGTKTYTGWSSKTYLKKVTTSKSGDIQPMAVDYADDEVGLLEVYGYDQNGTKLFKCQVDDTSKYYEYVKPRMYIGTKKVLADDAACPAPRKIVTKDKKGKVVKSENAESGAYGKWNDLDGKFVIKRTKNKKGTYVWSCALYAYKNGEIVKKMKTSNSLTSDSFPKGQLNYLGFYIGRYEQQEIVDVMSITHIKVTDLTPSTTESVNNQIFRDGDELVIDFETGLVQLNKRTFLKEVDIGSDFFKTPTGKTSVTFKTDDDKADITIGIQERFL